MKNSVCVKQIALHAGGCGRYQILLVTLVHLAKCASCFTILLMVFGAVVPDWWCVQGTSSTDAVTALFTSNMTSYKSCFVGNTTEKCSQFYFDPTVKTVVSKVCVFISEIFFPLIVLYRPMEGTCSHIFVFY